MAVVEERLGTEILGDKLFVRGKHECVSYSPDGLGCVDGQIVLFEFKCPYSRMPGNSVPVHYLPQVKYGMCVIDICDTALFIEGVFRACTAEQLLAGGYNTLLKQKVPKGAEPITYGLFYFNSVGAAADYGGSADINDIISVVDMSKFVHGTAEHITEEARKKLAEGQSILPWKLYSLHTHRVEKDPEFLAGLLPDIERVIKYVRDLTDPANRGRVNSILSKI
jgi:hypothetical protein